MDAGRKNLFFRPQAVDVQARACDINTQNPADLPVYIQVRKQSGPWVSNHRNRASPLPLPV